MITLISPAKSLDFDSPCDHEFTLPRFKKQPQELIEVLRTNSESDIQKLMDLSESLAVLNVERYHAFKKRHTQKNSKQAMFAFNGTVYVGLEPEKLTSDEVGYAQEHLRILSGMYGLLRPLDLIQAHRLEMGTRLLFDDYKTLYDFWGNQITQRINSDLRGHQNKIIVNLASQEYFKSINRKLIKGQIVDIEFKDLKNGEFKVLSFFAKKARGLMAQYIIKNNIDNMEDLKRFDVEGYQIDDSESTVNKILFKRT
jgi:cytoplasmic iron level regulating protein YaaA (DUF328/UPF0246 family)